MPQHILVDEDISGGLTKMSGGEVRKAGLREAPACGRGAA